MRQSIFLQYAIIASFFFLPVFSVAQDTEPGEWPKHKFDFLFKVSMNDLDFDDLGFLELTDQAGFGAAVGYAYEWKMMEKNHFRADVQYEFQSIKNSFDEGGNTTESEFTNHILGLNVLPVSYRFGNKLKPVVSLGAYANFLLASGSNSTLNGNDVDNIEFDINKFQTGWILGAGVYLDQKLLEVRFKQAFSDYISDVSESNRIKQISLILIL